MGGKSQNKPDFVQKSATLGLEWSTNDDEVRGNSQTCLIFKIVKNLEEISYPRLEFTINKEVSFSRL